MTEAGGKVVVGGRVSKNTERRSRKKPGVDRPTIDGGLEVRMRVLAKCESVAPD